MSTLPSQPLLVLADRVAPQAWRNGGGQTRELLAWPTAAAWQLRISRADIQASGPFSRFAGVQRWFVVLSGNGVVLHMPTHDHHTQDHTLLPGHLPLHFDGDLAPGCTLVQGPTQDLNLMAHGGQACMVPAEAAQPWQSVHAMCGLYSACAGVWQCGHHRVALQPHTLLWLQHAPQESMCFLPTDPASSMAWWLGYTPQAPT